MFETTKSYRSFRACRGLDGRHVGICLNDVEYFHQTPTGRVDVHLKSRATVHLEESFEDFWEAMGTPNP